MKAHRVKLPCNPISEFFHTNHLFLNMYPALMPFAPIRIPIRCQTLLFPSLGMRWSFGYFPSNFMMLYLPPNILSHLWRNNWAERDGGVTKIRTRCPWKIHPCLSSNTPLSPPSPQGFPISRHSKTSFQSHGNKKYCNHPRSKIRKMTEKLYHQGSGTGRSLFPPPHTASRG